MQMSSRWLTIATACLAIAAATAASPEVERTRAAVAAAAAAATSAPLSSTCDKLFIDIGANIGDSLVKWYTQPNCYEQCFERRDSLRELCLPVNETCGAGLRTTECGNANETCFCHKAAKKGECGWEWPWWMPLAHRTEYCAEAFEPNHLIAVKLQKNAYSLMSQGHARSIRVHNGTAVSLAEGYAQFGLDLTTTTGSSLVLHKKTLGANGRPGAGPPVSDHQTRVRTVDAVSYLRQTRARNISLKIDIEGSEYEVLRDLFVSGVLCDKVDNLWVEWHGGGRIDWRTLGLPTHEGEIVKMLSWMLRTVQGRQIVTRHDLSPHCRTYLGRWT